LVGHDLSLDVIGVLAVHRHGTVLTGVDVGTRQARLLLALLAVNRVRVVPVGRAVEALWGDAPPRRPTRNVATVVSRLRTVLGSDIVVGGRVGYRLGAQVRVDLFDASELVESAEAATNDDHALRSARLAVSQLDKGEVVDDWPDVYWAESARRMRASLLRRARHLAAEAALRVGDLRTARDAAEAAVAADAFDEVACRTLMCAYAAAGEPVRALLAYERLRSTLAAGLGVYPAPQTRDLHAAILQGAAAPVPVEGSRGSERPSMVG
jgi:DNA-binding SARP family transcriptional activator